MTNLHFIARCKGGTERSSLLVAAKRLNSVWMPYAFESIRYGRRGSRSAEVKVSPVMPYLFCEGSGDQMRHFLDHKNIFGTVWFIPYQSMHEIAFYRGRVEGAFQDNLTAWRRDERAFHCNYDPGQKVNLRIAGEQRTAEFRLMNSAGDYELDVEMFGGTRTLTASPYDVSAA